MLISGAPPLTDVRSVASLLRVLISMCYNRQGSVAREGRAVGCSESVSYCGIGTWRAGELAAVAGGLPRFVFQESTLSSICVF
jgi:hypothetical protein